ncbi:MAG: aminoacyl-tRNA hydrolase [Desulfovibrio sp.]|nr:aminoacyl-tRNA hydrolase [Desulfovibrio sp.]
MNTGILVGLGNPGLQYAHTRHNCGFDTLDLLLDEAAKDGRVRELPGSKFSCALWQITCPRLDGSWLCAKPMTFMNESGRCVQPLLAWHKIEPSNLIVIHDELDIQPGSLRFKFAGGNAGHNGLKSISQMLGTNDFYRLRIGIGRPKTKANVVNWVLGRPDAEEKEAILLAMHRAIDVLEVFTKEGLASATAKARSFA